MNEQKIQIKPKRWFLAHTDGTDEILSTYLASASSPEELVTAILDDTDELEHNHDYWNEIGKPGKNFETWNHEYVLSITNVLEITRTSRTEIDYKRIATEFGIFANEYTRPQWQSVIDIIEHGFITANQIDWKPTLYDKFISEVLDTYITDITDDIIDCETVTPVERIKYELELRLKFPTVTSLLIYVNKNCWDAASVINIFAQYVEPGIELNNIPNHWDT